MPRWSRRQTLHGIATASTLVLTGCGATTSGGVDDPPELSERVTNIKTRLVRDSAGEPLVVRDMEQSDRGEQSRTDAPQNPSVMEHLTNTEAIDEFRFRERAGASTLRAFATATDFASQSVYLLQQPIEECYELRLVGVYRDDDGVTADFCQTLRPADVACDAEAQDMIAVAIRLPFAGDDFNSVGGGWGGDCDPFDARALTTGSDGR